MCNHIHTRSTLFWHQDISDGKTCTGATTECVQAGHLHRGKMFYAPLIATADLQHYLDTRFVPSARLSGRNQTVL